MLAALTLGLAIALAQDVLTNGSFESIVGDAPAGWTRSAWGGEGEQRIGAVTRTGSRSVEIASRSGADIAWSCTVPVEIFSRYRLTGWIRTEDVRVQGGAHGALLNVHGVVGARTRGVTGTSGWTSVEIEFDTGLNDAIMVNCLFGGWGLATGRAWFDDVSLTLVARGRIPEPSITIDATDTGEPISEYIYGQFIEHLGRCIYGGIWAEMLDDRKFFHPVGAGDSPWRPVGHGEITMDTDRPYVGEHSVEIRLGPDDSSGGILHGRLALLEGRRYEGRVYLAGESGLEGAEVVLRWGPGEHDCAVAPLVRITPGFLCTDFGFTAGGSTSDGELRIVVRGDGAARVGAVSLMPADNVRGFRADTLELLRRLDAPVYRWPGGNFVSGYDWRDGVGDRDRRPPRKNPAWSGVEHNDVGIHEFMDLCALLGAEPYVAINTGLGSVESAAAELEYLNGPAASPMGRLRAANGREDPWKVRFIGVGNEMYGSWQLGHIPLAEYTLRHNTFVEALRAVDPSVTIIGVGAVGEWSRTMLRDCAGHMDHISEHVYWQERPGLLSHVTQAPQSLRATADAHRAYRRDLESLRERDIRICEDEWNYWYGPHVFGELGTRYFMKDALGCAAALNEFGRNSDLFFMANYAQTVNVIGAIKTSPANAAMETTGLVLELYRHHFGTIPCRTTSSPTLDSLAAWSDDRRTLTVAIVNASAEPADVRVTLTGATLTGSGVRREIASDDPMAYNDPDGASPVSIRESRVEGVADTLRVAPCSVTLYSLETR